MCFTPEGKLKADELGCGNFGEGFMREFVEYNGVAGSSATIYGRYSDKKGNCLVLGFSIPEGIDNNDSKGLLKGIRFYFSDPVLNHCAD